MPRLRFSVLLATAASIIGAAGCGGGGGASEISFSDRFTNVVPDLGGVDFYVDDVLRISNQAFGDSSAYEKRKAKDPTEVVSVNDAGTGNVLDAIEIDRVNKKSAHVFSLGLANPGNQQPGLRLLALLINRTPPSGNNSRVIVVHGYIRAVGFPTPNVDIHRTPDIIEVSNLPFGQSDSFTIAAGTYDFTVRITGIKDSQLIFDPGRQIEGGKVYLMLLQGVEGEGGNIAPAIQFIEEPPDN